MRSFSLTHFTSVLCLMGIIACEKLSPKDYSSSLSETHISVLRTKSSSNNPSSLETVVITKERAGKIVRESFPNKRLISLKDIMKQDKVVMYVASFEEGWALVSADNRSDRILAYSEHGSFDPNDIPNPGARFWFEMMKSEIASLPEISISTSNEENDNSRRGMIPRWYWIRTRVVDSLINQTTYDSGHLMTTTWGQMNPWNAKCPSYTYLGVLHHCPTGCVATAMSQILYYLHNNIEKPNGLYHTVGFSNPSLSSYNGTFYRSNYTEPSSRWEDMPLEKTGSNTGYVADLMIDVGNRVHMTYTVNGSYASSTQYAKDAFSAYGVACDTSSYQVYNVIASIKNGSPVMVRANNENNAGHAWVIDGLRENLNVYAYKDVWHLIYAVDPGLDLIEVYSPEEMALIDPDMYEGKTITGTYSGITNCFVLMNWGYDDNDTILAYNDVYYSAWNNASWEVNTTTYSYNKRIFYNFR